MLNNKVCPYKSLTENDDTSRVESFYEIINFYFGMTSLGLLVLPLLLAGYYSTFYFLLSYPLILSFLLWAYPYLIRNQFKPLTKHAEDDLPAKKIPFCSIFATIYDVLCRSSVLLRDIDLERQKKFGDIYLSFFGFRPVIIVTSATLVEKISKDYVNFAKSDPRDLCMPYFYRWVGNNNIVLANGNKWIETRKLIHPILNEVQTFLPLMVEKTKTFLDKLDNEVALSGLSQTASVKLTRWLKALSLDISGKALFGYDFNHLNEETNPGIDATDYVLREIFNPARLAMPIINRLPLESNKRLNTSIHLLDELVLKMIDYYLQQNESEKLISSENQNVLALLLSAQKENSLSQDALRNNILALVLASHETTQVSLSGVLYYLAKFPEWQEQLRQESIALFPDLLTAFSNDENVTDKRSSQYWKLKTFENLENFILESLRLYSPLANQNPRTTVQPVELGGHLIPKGTLVIMNLHAVHMDESEWNDPKRFNPNRFKKGNHTNKYAFLPFGNGPRICSGREFSLIEQKLAVCMILRKFKISLPDDDYIVPILRYSFTGMPDETFHLCFSQL